MQLRASGAVFAAALVTLAAAAPAAHGGAGAAERVSRRADR